MDEILPGVVHWAVKHPNTGQPAHSYLLVAERVVLDPMVPEGGLDAVREYAAPEHALLSTRHHLREAREFGCTIHASRPGLHDLPDELAHGDPVLGEGREALRAFSSAA